jgi:hypothetical protein
MPRRIRTASSLGGCGATQRFPRHSNERPQENAGTGEATYFLSADHFDDIRFNNPATAQERKKADQGFRLIHRIVAFHLKTATTGKQWQAAR